MAMIRSSSAPGTSRTSMEGNPFWSERARRELEISTSRPNDLPPVPADSDWEGSGEGTGGSVNGERGQKRMGFQVEEEGREAEAMRSDCFKTPEALEGKKQKVDGGRGKGQGNQPQASSDQSRQGEGEGLERALEQEMDEWFRQKEIEDRALEKQQQKELEKMKAQNMQLLRDQNERLMQEIEKMKLERRVMEFQQQKQQSAVTSMSEWSAVSPPPPKLGSPIQERKINKEESKYTPGGTRVPDGPPPVDQPEWRVPEFPDLKGGWPLNYEVMAEKFRTGRIGDREWRPRSPRSWSDDLRGGHRGGSGVCQEVRAGISGLQEGDRAWQDGVCQEDRAGILELQGCDRAWQDGVYQEDRAGIFEPQGCDRAWRDGARQEDRASSHELQGGVRAIVHGGDRCQEGGRGVHGQVQEDERVRKLE